MLAALRGETDRIPAINRVLLRNWTVNRGANVADRCIRSGKTSPSPTSSGGCTRGIFYVDPTNAQGIERLMQLADDRGHPGLLAPAPACRRSFKPCATRAAPRPRYEQFVRSFVARYPRLLTVLDARRGAYPPSLFTDHTHLNGRGAIALSRAVAKAVPTAARPLAIRVRLPAGSLLAIPSDQPAGSGVAIEDLEESRQILDLEHEPPLFRRVEATRDLREILRAISDCTATESQRTRANLATLLTNDYSMGRCTRRYGSARCGRVFRDAPAVRIDCERKGR